MTAPRADTARAASPAAPDRSYFAGLDRDDPLGPLRDAFDLPPDLIYLDGNSLGAPPVDTLNALHTTVRGQWRNDLNTGWFRHGWLDLPVRVGDAIGTLVGAGPGQVVVGESTSTNLFKLLWGALEQRPGRRTVLSDAGNFPSDLYVAGGVAGRVRAGNALRVVATGEILDHLDEDVAVVMLSHVDYRTGAILPMREITERAHEAGALVLWDLCHSAGALPVRLDECGVDLAVGCGYKYLNGGPGAPAFMYVARRLMAGFEQPITGWIGHRDPFAFDPSFERAPTAAGLLSGCPPVLGLVALQEGVNRLRSADMGRLRAKAVRLTEWFVRLATAPPGNAALTLLGPSDPGRRGNHVSFTHPEARAVVAELLRRRVMVEFRPPDVIRVGIAPLYVRYVDIWDAARALTEALAAATGRPARDEHLANASSEGRSA